MGRSDVSEELIFQIVFVTCLLEPLIMSIHPDEHSVVRSMHKVQAASTSIAIVDDPSRILAPCVFV